MFKTRLTQSLGGLVAAFVLAQAARAAAPVTLTVHAGNPGPAIAPGLYGLMTEEINHAFDGGLYAELIQNRTFQDNAKTPAHWTAVGGAAIEMTRADPVNPALPVSLTLALNGGISGVANDGFWGIPVKPATTYTASFYAKAAGGFAGPVTASILSDDDKTVFAKTDTEAVTGEWKKLTVKLTTAADATPTTKAKFVLAAAGQGTVSFSLVSLFPPTHNDRPNGTRPDLMKLMAALKPTYIRLPGGNYLEGDTIATRFDWKKQIGPIDQRPGHMGCWRYRSSDGFGLTEMLGWCQDLNAEVVLGVFAGYALKGEYIEAGPKLQPFVDEALEEIEYCQGGPDTEWGKRRIADGFPKPFKIRYVEVGNEDWFDKSKSYDGRFAQFFDAIKAKYPDIQVIATMPVKSRRPDVLDDHFYRSPRAMARDYHHYDKTDRSGPKIFVGEWASQGGRPTPTLASALGDAAWLIGLERNSDHVIMAAYAPLFANVNTGAWQWGTNLIGYDALNSFGSPSYYAQVMLAEHKGDTVLPTDVATGPVDVSAEPVAHGAVGVGTWHTAAEYKDISVTAPDGKTLLADAGKDLGPWKRARGATWSAKDGAIVQSSTTATNATAVIGDPAWTDYTLRLKARKTAGDEGFLILVRAIDADNRIWWNLGGWGNTRSALEFVRDGDHMEFAPSDTKIETGRWYDLRLEVAGRHVKAFVDDKLVSEGDTPAIAGTNVFAGASYDKTAGEVIVKVVNMANEPAEAAIKLDGAGTVTATGRAIVLSGAGLNDVNTIAEPMKMAPKEEPLTDAAASFNRTLPPRSFTILRVPVKQ